MTAHWTSSEEAVIWHLLSAYSTDTKLTRKVEVNVTLHLAKERMLAFGTDYYISKKLVSRKFFRCEEYTMHGEVRNSSIADLLTRLQPLQEVPCLVSRMPRTIRCQL